MSHEITVRPTEVKFLEKLKESKHSVVFKVWFQDKICIMKVYHDREPSEDDSPDSEVNLFVCESTAYVRLKAKGLCERGVVPYFCGLVRNLKSALWTCFDMFLDNSLPPNAILIEYIPNLQQIDLTNFSKGRLARIRQILDDIHEAGVLHGDPMPQNMMISPGGQGKQGEQDRVLWIDRHRN
ncbi:hypothetical protein BDV06DRAFT_187527 [Aspergillus oleicola]